MPGHGREKYAIYLQHRGAKQARKSGNVGEERLVAYREIVDQFGITEFVGYSDDSCDARILALGQSIEAALRAAGCAIPG